VKGASVLGMVERWLGQETFQSGVRAYLTSHTWSNATARDLFSALDAKSGRNVTGVMDGFLDQTGVPQVKVALDCSAKAAPRVKIEQTEYRPLGSASAASPKLWRFPVCLKQEAGAAPKTQCTVLEGATSELSLENTRCPRWLFPNADAAGYYRMRLSKDELAGLAKLPVGQLSDAEKVALANDSWAVVKSGELDADAYLELLPQLSDKADRVLWEQLITVLGELDRSLVADSSRAEFQRRVTALVGPAARRHGWEIKPNDSHQVRLLRSKLLWALGSLGADAWARKEAALRAERWLKDPNSVDGDIALVALELHARTAGPALFDALKAKLAAAPTPEARLVALKGMTGFDDPKLVERLLGMTIDGSIKMQDLRYVFAPLFERRATRDVAYSWLTAHFSELEKRLPSFIVGRTVWVMASLCNEERVKQAEAFFRPRVERMEGASKHLSQAMEAGKLCAAVAVRQSPSVERWLSPKGKKPEAPKTPVAGVAPPARGVAPTKP
jgi:aminopeptidase N